MAVLVYEPTHLTTEVYLEDYGPITYGTTDCGTAFTAAIADAVANKYPIFLNAGGVYAYATSPNFGVEHLMIIGNGAMLKHTGTGNAFVMDAGDPTGDKFDLRMSDLRIKGNANSDNCILSRGVHHCLFDNIRALGAKTTGAALRVEAGVGNTWINFRCTTSEKDNAATMPQDGIILTERTPAEGCYCFHFTQTIIEGLAGTGINMDVGMSNTFISGTSESNAIGFKTGTQSGHNLIENLHFEACTTRDVDLSGSDDIFIKITSVGTGSDAILVNSGAYRNLFIGGRYSANAITDNGTDTTFISMLGTTNLVVNRVHTDELIKAATGYLAPSDCYNTIISNQGQIAENTQILPVAAAGLSFLATITTAGTGAVHYKPQATDKICLDGTWLDDADKVSLATPAVGNLAKFQCIKTGATAWDWYCDTINGTYTDGGQP